MTDIHANIFSSAASRYGSSYAQSKTEDSSAIITAVHAVGHVLDEKKRCVVVGGRNTSPFLKIICRTSLPSTSSACVYNRSFSSTRSNEKNPYVYTSQSHRSYLDHDFAFEVTHPVDIITSSAAGHDSIPCYLYQSLQEGYYRDGFIVAASTSTPHISLFDKAQRTSKAAINIPGLQNHGLLSLDINDHYLLASRALPPPSQLPTYTGYPPGSIPPGPLPIRAQTDSELLGWDIRMISRPLSRISVPNSGKESGPIHIQFVPGLSTLRPYFHGEEYDMQSMALVVTGDGRLFSHCVGVDKVLHPLGGLPSEVVSTWASSSSRRGGGGGSAGAPKADPQPPVVSASLSPSGTQIVLARANGKLELLKPSPQNYSHAEEALQSSRFKGGIFVPNGVGVASEEEAPPISRHRAGLWVDPALGGQIQHRGQQTLLGVWAEGTEKLHNLLAQANVNETPTVPVTVESLSTKDKPRPRYPVPSRPLSTNGSVKLNITSKTIPLVKDLPSQALKTLGAAAGIIQTFSDHKHHETRPNADPLCIINDTGVVNGVLSVPISRFLRALCHSSAPCTADLMGSFQPPSLDLAARTSVAAIADTTIGASGVSTDLAKAGYAGSNGNQKSLEILKYGPSPMDWDKGKVNEFLQKVKKPSYSIYRLYPQSEDSLVTQYMSPLPSLFPEFPLRLRPVPATLPASSLDKSIGAMGSAKAGGGIDRNDPWGKKSNPSTPPPTGPAAPSISVPAPLSKNELPLPLRKFLEVIKQLDDRLSDINHMLSLLIRQDPFEFDATSLLSGLLKRLLEEDGKIQFPSTTPSTMLALHPNPETFPPSSAGEKTFYYGQPVVQDPNIPASDHSPAAPSIKEVFANSPLHPDTLLRAALIPISASAEPSLGLQGISEVLQAFPLDRLLEFLKETIAPHFSPPPPSPNTFHGWESNLLVQQAFPSAPLWGTGHTLSDALYASLDAVLLSASGAPVPLSAPGIGLIHQRVLTDRLNEHLIAQASLHFWPAHSPYPLHDRRFRTHNLSYLTTNIQSLLDHTGVYPTEALRHLDVQFKHRRDKTENPSFLSSSSSTTSSSSNAKESLTPARTPWEEAWYQATRRYCHQGEGVGGMGGIGCLTHHLSDIDITQKMQTLAHTYRLNLASDVTDYELDQLFTPRTRTVVNPELVNYVTEVFRIGTGGAGGGKQDAEGSDRSASSSNSKSTKSHVISVHSIDYEQLLSDPHLVWKIPVSQFPKGQRLSSILYTSLRASLQGAATTKQPATPLLDGFGVGRGIGKYASPHHSYLPHAPHTLALADAPRDSRDARDAPPQSAASIPGALRADRHARSPSSSPVRRGPITQGRRFLVKLDLEPEPLLPLPWDQVYLDPDIRFLPERALKARSKAYAAFSGFFTPRGSGSRWMDRKLASKRVLPNWIMAFMKEFSNPLKSQTSNQRVYIASILAHATNQGHANRIRNLVKSWYELSTQGNVHSDLRIKSTNSMSLTFLGTPFVTPTPTPSATPRPSIAGSTPFFAPNAPATASTTPATVSEVMAASSSLTSVSASSIISTHSQVPHSGASSLPALTPYSSAQMQSLQKLVWNVIVSPLSQLTQNLPARSIPATPAITETAVTSSSSSTAAKLRTSLAPKEKIQDFVFELSKNTCMFARSDEKIQFFRLHSFSNEFATNFRSYLANTVVSHLRPDLQVEMPLLLNQPLVLPIPQELQTPHCPSYYLMPHVAYMGLQEDAFTPDVRSSSVTSTLTPLDAFKRFVPPPLTSRSTVASLVVAFLYLLHSHFPLRRLIQTHLCSKDFCLACEVRFALDAISMSAQFASKTQFHFCPNALVYLLLEKEPIRRILYAQKAKPYPPISVASSSNRASASEADEYLSMEHLPFALLTEILNDLDSATYAVLDTVHKAPESVAGNIFENEETKAILPMGVVELPYQAQEKSLTIPSSSSEYYSNLSKKPSAGGHDSPESNVDQPVVVLPGIATKSSKFLPVPALRFPYTLDTSSTGSPFSLATPSMMYSTHFHTQYRCSHGHVETAISTRNILPLGLLQSLLQISHKQPSGSTHSNTPCSVSDCLQRWVDTGVSFSLQDASSLPYLEMLFPRISVDHSRIHPTDEHNTLQHHHLYAKAPVAEYYCPICTDFSAVLEVSSKIVKLAPYIFVDSATTATSGQTSIPESLALQVPSTTESALEQDKKTYTLVSSVSGIRPTLPLCATSSRASDSNIRKLLSTSSATTSPDASHDASLQDVPYPAAFFAGPVLQYSACIRYSPAGHSDAILPSSITSSQVSTDGVDSNTSDSIQHGHTGEESTASASGSADSTPQWFVCHPSSPSPTTHQEALNFAPIWKVPKLLVYQLQEEPTPTITSTPKIYSDATTAWSDPSFLDAIVSTAWEPADLTAEEMRQLPTIRAVTSASLPPNTPTFSLIVPLEQYRQTIDPSFAIPPATFRGPQRNLPRYLRLLLPKTAEYVSLACGFKFPYLFPENPSLADVYRVPPSVYSIQSLRPTMPKNVSKCDTAVPLLPPHLVPGIGDFIGIDSELVLQPLDVPYAVGSYDLQDSYRLKYPVSHTPARLSMILYQPNSLWEDVHLLAQLQYRAHYASQLQMDSSLNTQNASYPYDASDSSSVDTQFPIELSPSGIDYAALVIPDSSLNPQASTNAWPAAYTAADFSPSALLANYFNIADEWATYLKPVNENPAISASRGASKSSELVVPVSLSSLLDIRFVVVGPISDVLTRFSGITQADVSYKSTKYPLLTAKNAILRLRAVMDNGATIIGHAVDKDLQELSLFHLPYASVLPVSKKTDACIESVQLSFNRLDGLPLVFDAAQSSSPLLPFRFYPPPIDTSTMFIKSYARKFPLRWLCQVLLGVSVQSGDHDSEEDSIAAMFLYFTNLLCLAVIGPQGKQLLVSFLKRWNNESSSGVLPLPDFQKRAPLPFLPHIAAVEKAPAVLPQLPNAASTQPAIVPRGKYVPPGAAKEDPKTKPVLDSTSNALNTELISSEAGESASSAASSKQQDWISSGAWRLRQRLTQGQNLYVLTDTEVPTVRLLPPMLCHWFQMVGVHVFNSQVHRFAPTSMGIEGESKTSSRLSSMDETSSVASTSADFTTGDSMSSTVIAPFVPTTQSRVTLRTTSTVGYSTGVRSSQPFRSFTPIQRTVTPTLYISKASDPYPSFVPTTDYSSSESSAPGPFHPSYSHSAFSSSSRSSSSDIFGSSAGGMRATSVSLSMPDTTASTGASSALQGPGTGRMFVNQVTSFVPFRPQQTFQVPGAAGAPLGAANPSHAPVSAANVPTSMAMPSPSNSVALDMRTGGMDFSRSRTGAALPPVDTWLDAFNGLTEGLLGVKQVSRSLDEFNDYAKLLHTSRADGRNVY